ncbi:thioesterase II family protein [Streptomyces rochei]|uniref:thioesterase II family protein n=1 Tax=Streptomyces TaxID=1883 RepID=UPI000F7A8D3C|nr:MULTISPECIES: alpha/beta fold hydrolase [Streptomyces]MBX4179629.1 alpha/beta fold hydrolase [Streptomyces geysiriensis]RSS87310.1 thioesterase [Streptomyces sp. WAC02707]UAX51606.1 alpha/beta fold hydrolase [Streptomyces sp. A144]UAX57891.1 alpha/beta fold hydrolase [Streptomyces sp. A144]
MASRSRDREAGTARITLTCLAHAGAGVASYRGWSAAVGPGIDVAALPLPGRDSRRREPRLTERAGLLADFLPTLLQTARRGPYALYGHSMGALVGYTLTRALADSGLPPLFLAVGACPPPHTTTVLADAADLPDEDLLPLLDEIGSLPPGASASPGGLWRRTFLPVLRDDLRLARSLRNAALDPVTGGPLDVPVLVFAGRDDPLAAPAALRHWQQWTTNLIELHTVAGGHFFASSSSLAQHVGRACRGHVTALSTGGGR